MNKNAIIVVLIIMTVYMGYTIFQLKKQTENLHMQVSALHARCSALQSSLEFNEGRLTELKDELESRIHNLEYNMD